MIALALALLVQAPIPPPAPVAAAPRPAGEIFMDKCKVCHGEDGKGRTPKGRKLKAENFTSPKWQGHMSDEAIVKAITFGIPKHKMPAFRTKLTPEEIRSLVPYLRNFAGR